MKPEYRDMNVVAMCPDCGAPTTFEWKDGSNSREFGYITVPKEEAHAERTYIRPVWRMLRCSTCHRAGLAELKDNGDSSSAVLFRFHPTAIDRVPLPTGVPVGVVEEFREAEKCAAASAWRGAAALLRSTLEKTLKESGYEKGSLFEKIEQASKDGVITDARKRRAHDLVRVLGNDVLHEAWRKVDPGEVDDAHHYVQRVLEDLYDDRASVEAILRHLNRLPLPES